MKKGEPLYLPNEYRAMIEALATPLDASKVTGELSWPMLDEKHDKLSWALRKKLGFVPPKRSDERKRVFISEGNATIPLEQDVLFEDILDELVVTGFTSWNTAKGIAPTAEILIDMAYQLQSTSEHSTREWFILLCSYVDPFGRAEPFDSLVETHEIELNFFEHRPESERVKYVTRPTNVFRTLQPKLYGPNGSRTALSLEKIQDIDLRAATEAWREGDCVVELLTAMALGDNLGDTIFK